LRRLTEALSVLEKESVLDDDAAALRHRASPIPPSAAGAKEVQQNFRSAAGETAFLFLQHSSDVRPAGARRRHQEHFPFQHRQRLG